MKKYSYRTGVAEDKIKVGLNICWKNTSASFSFTTNEECEAFFEYISNKLNPTIIEVKRSAEVLEVKTLK